MQTDQEYTERFFKHEALPFVECRYTRASAEIFKPHLHRCFCIGAMEKGEIEFLIGGQKTSLAPGLLALINPDTLHSCNPIKHCARSFYMLYLDLDWCLQVQQSLWQNSSFFPVDCAYAKDPALYELFVDTAECLMDVSHLLEKEQHLATFVEAVFARCCSPVVPVQGHPEKVAELKEWLSGNLDEDLPLERFAQAEKVNPYTLLRNFRNTYGITPYAFRMNCRIEYGRKLLQQGVDIGDTAQMCGFFDQSHFHRHFKAVTLVTPKQYQQSLLLK